MSLTSCSFSSCRYQWDDVIWTCYWSYVTWCQLLSPNLHDLTLLIQMHEDYVDLILHYWKFQETFAFQTYVFTFAFHSLACATMYCVCTTILIWLICTRDWYIWYIDEICLLRDMFKYIVYFLHQTMYLL